MMKKTIKIIIFTILVSTMCVLINCKSKSKINPQVEIIQTIRETRLQYDDNKLVEEMMRLCNDEFQNIDNKDLSIIFNYVVSCHNEDASEGLYDVLGENIVFNEMFSIQLIDYLENTPADGKKKFKEKLAESIILYQYVIDSDIDESDTNSIDSVYNYIVDHLPQHVLDSFYNKDNNKLKQMVKEIIQGTYVFH